MRNIFDLTPIKKPSLPAETGLSRMPKCVECSKKAMVHADRCEKCERDWRVQVAAAQRFFR